MKSKKIFHIIDCCFVLPNDFDGDSTDALKLIVKYINNREMDVGFEDEGPLRFLLKNKKFKFAMESEIITERKMK